MAEDTGTSPNKKRPLQYWPWVLAGIGCAFLLGLVVLGNILLIGERLARVSALLEHSFYALIALLFYICFLHPAFIVAFRPRMMIHPFLKQDSIITSQQCRSVAKRLWRHGRLSDSARKNLRSVWRDGDGLQIAVKKIIAEKDELAGSIITEQARLAFLSTAISQNGSLDAVMLAYTNVKVIKKLVEHYACRPSFAQLARLYGQVITCSLVAQRIEDIELGDVFPHLGASMGGSVASWVPGLQIGVTSLLQGTGSALLTLRTGFIAREYILSGGETFDQGEARRRANKQAFGCLLSILKLPIPNLPSTLQATLKKFMPSFSKQTTSDL